MPKIDLDAIEADDWCDNEGITACRDTITALIAELRAAREVVEAFRQYADKDEGLPDTGVTKQEVAEWDAEMMDRLEAAKAAKAAYDEVTK